MRPRDAKRNGGGARRASRAGLVAALALALASPLRAQAGAPLELTLESAVELAMGDSYRVRRLRLEIERTRSLLEAQRAGLKSRVFMTFALPEFERISESRWNSTLQKDEIVRSNSRMWQMDFTVEQPVILFGFPTNGSLSANNRVYRYTQIGQNEDDVSYYNRYFLRYRQPFFQPNYLRNSLEDARLDYTRSELAFQGDAIAIIADIAQEYNRLFQLAYQGEINASMVESLELAAAAARERAAADPAKAIEVSQVQVALANAQGELQESHGDFRLAASRMKQRLRLEADDSISIRTDMQVTPIQVDAERAVELGITLRPQLRILDIERQKGEIDLEQTRGNGSFRMDVELTYGREMEDEVLRGLLDQPSNSYTIGVRGTLPIWDWGARRARIDAQQAVLSRTQLSIQETREQIEVEIRNMVRNLDEYHQRALNMERNLTLARQVSAQTLEQYRQGSITILDLLQSFERQEATARNFLQAFLGYRGAILDLQRMTYYDFENEVPVLERFGIQAES